jgi:hypothetical protein
MAKYDHYNSIAKANRLAYEEEHRSYGSGKTSSDSTSKSSDSKSGSSDSTRKGSATQGKRR